MANMRVKHQVEKISNELDRLVNYVRQYSGISEADARYVDTIAGEIAVQASVLAAEARAKVGNRSASTLTKNVRKALGYTYP